MSISLMTQVWARLDVSGGELILALSLADFASDSGENIFPSVKTLCEKTRQSRSTVQRQLARFRDVGWLEVVGQGGLIGGRERTVEYRVNPEWVKGVNLTTFPDVVREGGAEIKGPNLTGLPNKGPDSQHERAPNEAVKGLTAMTHDPSGSTIKPLSDESPPPTPSGPRASSPKDPAGFDESQSRRYWWTHAVNFTLGSACALELAPFGVQRLDQMPLNVYALMRDVCRQVTDDAIAEERQKFPLTGAARKLIESGIEGRITRDLMAIKSARVAA